MTTPTGFFISYRHTHAKWAEWIAWVLEEAGYKVDLDRWDIPPGSNVVSHIDSALESADRVIAVISEDYFDSGWTEAEWTAALSSGIEQGWNRLLLVKVEPVRLGGILSPYRFIDLYKYSDEDAKRILLESVEATRRKPSAPPPSPRQSISRPTFPAYYPKIWNVPDPNLFFAGREIEIDSIYEGLHHNQPAAIAAARGITGLGGVGKTQLATEYAYRYRGEYDVVWWVDAEGGLAIKTALVQLAAALGLTQHPFGEIDDAIRQLELWLRDNPRWLLIYDNVTEPQQVQGFTFPQCPGHILLTSRHPNWGHIAKQVNLDVFQPKEAIAFIVERTRSPNVSGAAELCEHLGFLPLALEQAGAYIEQMGLSIEEYSALYAAHGMYALEQGRPTGGYSASVRTTWAISIEELRKASPHSASILVFLSFLASEDFPISIIVKQAECFPELVQPILREPLEFNRIIKPLLDFSLARRSNRNLRVHRLVQAVVRDELTPEQRQQWSEIAVHILEKALPEGVSTEVGIWPVYAELLPHALAATTFAEREETAQADVVTVLLRVGSYQTQMAAFGPGEESLKRALVLSRRANGEQHYMTGMITNNMAQLYHAQGRLMEARDLYSGALPMLVSYFGPEHSEIATILSNMGEVARELGQYDFSQRLHHRALGIRELQLGAQHPDVAVSSSNLGLLYENLGEHSKAEAMLQRALMIDESNYGRNHHSVATDLNNLGIVHNSVGDYARAAACFDEALTIRRDLLGSGHPHVFQSMQNLALSYHFLDQHQEAVVLFWEALQGWENTYSPEHPDLGACNLNIGTCLVFTGDFTAAIAALERALRINKKNGWSDAECQKLAQIISIVKSRDEDRIGALKRALKSATSALRGSEAGRAGLR